MDLDAFNADILEVLKKYEKPLAAFVYGMTYQDAEGNIMTYGTTIVPVEVRDHEEEILRNKCAKDVAEKVTQLTKNVYMGR